MAKAKNNLNSKSSEYIEENFLSDSPEGLPPCATVPEIGEIVVAADIPEMKRIMFVNNRDPGYPLDFHYHSKTHPLKHYTLYHGKEYDLPVEIVEHLDNICRRNYGYRQGPNGHPEMYTKSYDYQFRCQPVKKTA